MSASPFLLGRCLWAASRFASFLPGPLLNRYLQATVEALQPHQNVILRITAVRAGKLLLQSISFFLFYLANTQLFIFSLGIL